MRQPGEIVEVHLLKGHLALQPPKRDPGAEQQKDGESREAGPPSPDAEHGNGEAAEGVETSAETIVQDLAAIEGERYRPWARHRPGVGLLVAIVAPFLVDEPGGEEA